MSSSIKLLAMDVDGTLTDGKLHISESSELFNTFYPKGGHALVLHRDGGDGAVREFVEWILCNNQRGAPC